MKSVLKSTTSFKDNHIWGKVEDNFVNIMEVNQNPYLLRKALKDIVDVNVTHRFTNTRYKDAEFSLLFHTSLSGNSTALELLLERGADLAWRNEKNSCLFFMLMERDQHEMADVCFDSIPDITGRKKFVNSYTYSGFTPMILAATYGRRITVKWLLDHGADPDHTMSSGFTAVQAAFDNKHVDTLQELINAGAVTLIRGKNYAKGLEE